MAKKKNRAAIDRHRQKKAEKHKAKRRGKHGGASMRDFEEDKSLGAEHDDASMFAIRQAIKGYAMPPEIIEEERKSHQKRGSLLSKISVELNGFLHEDRDWNISSAAIKSNRKLFTARGALEIYEQLLVLSLLADDGDSADISGSDSRMSWERLAVATAEFRDKHLVKLLGLIEGLEDFTRYVPSSPQWKSFEESFKSIWEEWNPEISANKALSGLKLVIGLKSISLDKNGQKLQKLEAFLKRYMDFFSEDSAASRLLLLSLKQAFQTRVIYGKSDAPIAGAEKVAFNKAKWLQEFPLVSTQLGDIDKFDALDEQNASYYLANIRSAREAASLIPMLEAVVNKENLDFEETLRFRLSIAKLINLSESSGGCIPLSFALEHFTKLCHLVHSDLLQEAPERCNLAKHVEPLVTEMLVEYVSHASCYIESSSLLLEQLKTWPNDFRLRCMCAATQLLASGVGEKRRANAESSLLQRVSPGGVEVRRFSANCFADCFNFIWQVSEDPGLLKSFANTIYVGLSEELKKECLRVLCTSVMMTPDAEELEATMLAVAEVFFDAKCFLRVALQKGSSLEQDMVFFTAFAEWIEHDNILQLTTEQVMQVDQHCNHLACKYPLLMGCLIAFYDDFQSAYCPVLKRHSTGVGRGAILAHSEAMPESRNSGQVGERTPFKENSARKPKAAELSTEKSGTAWSKPGNKQLGLFDHAD